LGEETHNTIVSLQFTHVNLPTQTENNSTKFKVIFLYHIFVIRVYEISFIQCIDSFFSQYK